MKPLAPDEKTAMVMLYTHNMLVRGEVDHQGKFTCEYLASHAGCSKLYSS